MAFNLRKQAFIIDEQELQQKLTDIDAALAAAREQQTILPEQIEALEKQKQVLVDMQTAMAGSQQMSYASTDKPIKKAQFEEMSIEEEPLPMEEDLLDGSMDIEDPINDSTGTEVSVKIFEDSSQLQNYLEEQSEMGTDISTIYKEVIPPGFTSEEELNLKDLITAYMESDDITSRQEYATKLFLVLLNHNAAGEEQVLEEQTEEAIPMTANKKFNLKKQARRMNESYVLEGPENTTYCPKLRNQISQYMCRYHCLDGLLMGDQKKVACGEAIWRGTVMDKFSRQYKDKDGEWVGGYLNKRFETTRNTEGNDLQIKAKNKRIEDREEYWNYERRMEQMRADEGKERGYAPTEGTDYNKEETQKFASKISSSEDCGLHKVAFAGKEFYVDTEEEVESFKRIAQMMMEQETPMVKQDEAGNWMQLNIETGEYEMIPEEQVQDFIQHQQQVAESAEELAL